MNTSKPESEFLDTDFDLFFDIKTKEQLYKEMAYHQNTLNELRELCDVSGVPYNDPDKNLKLSNKLYKIAAWMFAGTYMVELLFNYLAR